MPVTIFLMTVERRVGHFGWLHSLLTASDLKRQLCREREGGKEGGEGGREGGREGGEGGREGGREKKHVNTNYNSTLSFLPLPPSPLT